ncbi:hypothetical protein K32_25150 [Kaistia sp. 32K]|uniref:DUF488 domain-containing protein n=1 Tax=Kaistia sp. 32K TaxID=2795690 RepID=UPI001915DE97|nr:DUF488 domain-containing protein [Kaistia sp. 32K]BCP53898.1 hypothetical protein K32_25150 [Kaistia sp. 32K]
MIQLKRIYDPPSPADGLRVLVDRLWPRGIKKEDAALDLWARDLAPSDALRKWFHHEVANWDEFETRYRAELAQMPDAVEALRERCAGHTVTLLFGAKDETHNQAVILKDVLEVAKHAP